jgi:hypothetical protein
MTTIQLTYKRVVDADGNPKDSRNYAKFRLVSGEEHWATFEKCQYIPMSSPLASLMEFTATIEIPEV